MRQTTLALGTTDYYGFMFYVPVGWKSGTTDANDSFWGVTIAQFHFQNIWGSPIEFELHTSHLTLALETGACNSFQTRVPGCRWRSNADNPDGRPGNLGRFYVVPPPMEQGVWHHVIMRVHWAAGRAGAIAVWTRTASDKPWIETVNLRGRPTVQWDKHAGCCDSDAADKVGSYRGLASTPVSVWLGGLVVGTGFQAVAAALPATG